MGVEIIPMARLTAPDRDEILALCSAAYAENFAPYLDLLPDPLHFVVRDAGRIVAHACTVTRWLQASGGPLLRTAYVEAVATLPAAQGRGHATRTLAAIPAAVADYDIAALSPSDFGFYERLGWQPWRGPLLIRMAEGSVPAEDEEAMILRLPRTPPLDLDGPLSIEFRPGEVW